MKKKVLSGLFLTVILMFTGLAHADDGNWLLCWQTKGGILQVFIEKNSITRLASGKIQYKEKRLLKHKGDKKTDMRFTHILDCKNKTKTTISCSTYKDNVLIETSPYHDNTPEDIEDSLAKSLYDKFCNNCK